MGIPISTLQNVHWVDRVKIEIYPLGVNQVVKILFYAEDDSRSYAEVAAFTEHKFVEMKAEVKKNLTTILIKKKEGKSGRIKKQNNKKE